MSTYTFLPWARRGLARKITNEDTLGADDGSAVERASVNVALVLGYFPVGGENVASDTLLVERTAKVLGPGDAVGVRQRAIIDRVPAAGSSGFPANHLVYVTFYEEDFPWRFTPARPAGDKLRPWLALVVLKADADEYTLTARAQQLSVLTVKAAHVRAVLPPQDELWAWAHVHATSAVADAQELQDLIEASPNLALSRLVAPRRLQPDLKYHAFLVPVFETGRRAGLGASVESVSAQKPAWPSEADYASGAATAQDVQLPVYHHWTFETRDEGDFETLVSALRPRVAGAEFGLRDMNVAAPGLGLDGILSDKALALEGALQPPLHAPAPFPAPNVAAEQTYVQRLEQVLDLSANLARSGGQTALPAAHPFGASGHAGGFAAAVSDDPIVVPPTYGKWHAAVERLASTPADKAWLRTINLDPRQRVAAGAGAKVVQSRDEELAERAWEQVGEVLAANQRLRESELVTHVAQRMHERHIAPLDDDRLMMLSRSAQGQVLPPLATNTVRGLLADSPVPAAVLSAAFRRATRPQRKWLRDAMGGDGKQKVLQSGLVSGLNATSIVAAAPKTAYVASVTIAQVEQSIALASTQLVEEVEAPSHVFIRLLWEDLSGRGGALPALATWKTELLASATAPEVTDLIRAITSVSGTATSATVQVDTTVLSAHFEEGVKGKHYGGLLVEAATGDGRYSRAVLAADVEQYQQGVTSFRAGALARLPTVPTAAPRSDLPNLATSLRDQLSPLKALPLRVQQVVRISDASALASSTPARVMAYPHFPEPQFEYLKQLSYEFIIPNVQGLPANTVTLLETNQRFIEAFMAGMNHEMARELLWREYPTDKRGTYFERFWDTGDSLEDDPPADIQPMDAWVNPLGDNSERANDALLVLTIRSELFRQYPRTLVYAQRATWETDASGVRKDLPRRLKEPTSDDDLIFPTFNAELEPDIGIFAFALEAEVAQGNAADPGWFFVLKERPGQPRFGADEGPADELVDWNALTYNHLKFPDVTPELLRVAGNTGPQLQPTSNDTTRPIAARWGRSSADMAYALLQAPVLYARHASEMLPPASPV